MDEPQHKNKLNPLRALIVRHCRRRAWAYVLWILVYLPTAWLFAGEMDAHSEPGILAMLPLLIPLAVAVGQMIYPTLLGWYVIIIPSVLYTGVGVFYLIRNATERQPQWQHDLSGFILGSIFVGAFVVVCIALIFCTTEIEKYHERCWQILLENGQQTV
jgi:hypothetical protein